MPKPKKIIKKLDAVELEDTILQIHQYDLDIQLIKTKQDLLKEQVIATLGVKGVFQKDYPKLGLWRCTIVQSWRRSISWKDIAIHLAKRLYPEREPFRRWLRTIAKNHPKKPCNPFVKLSQIKDKQKEKEARRKPFLVEQ